MLIDKVHIASNSFLQQLWNFSARMRRGHLGERIREIFDEIKNHVEREGGFVVELEFSWGSCFNWLATSD